MFLDALPTLVILVIYSVGVAPICHRHTEGRLEHKCLKQSCDMSCDLKVILKDDPNMKSLKQSCDMSCDFKVALKDIKRKCL